MNIFEIVTLIGGAGIGAGILKIIFTMGKIAKSIETMQSDIGSLKLSPVNGKDSCF